VRLKLGGCIDKYHNPDDFIGADKSPSLVRNRHKMPLITLRLADARDLAFQGFCPRGLATFRRKNDVSGIEVNGLPQNKTRRGERRA
jgi:hypothetical protein